MATTSTTITPHQHQSPFRPKSTSAKETVLSAFDLTKVGLGGTLGVGIFLVIGYIAKSIAGPSVILSVIIAAIIAFSAGTFYAELNCTIVMSLWRSVQSKTPSLSLASTATIPSISATISPPTGTASDETHTSHSVPDMLTSKLLMPSFIFTYLCMGEFAGFVVGWNLLLEQIIGVALVAKGIASYFDVLIFDGVQVNITQVQPITSNISEYFDFFAFFIPILIAGPLLLILRRSTILSVVSVVSSISVVVFILILGAINANVANWTANSTGHIPPNSTEHLGDGGFFPYGVGGMFRGAAIVLFVFIGFDAMAYYPLNWYASEEHKIVDFQRTVTTSILSINGILFVALIGATVALTSIQPYYSLKEILPLPNAFASVGWSGTIFIVLIAGIIALFGSLFAFMHAILRTIQAMAFDGPRAFKLFAKFEQNNLLREIQLQLAKQQQQTSPIPQRHPDEIDIPPQYHNHRQQQLPILGCLIFALLAGLMAALLTLEQLMNLLSIGALLMFYTLTLDIILLRYSPNLKKVFSQPTSASVESEPCAGDAPKRHISLIATLLTVYCILCIVLVAFIKLVDRDVLQMPHEWSIVLWIAFTVAMVSILFVIGLQPKRNSMFELKLSVNPVFPAANIFACIYLLSELNVVTWIRYIIWMLIGIALYIITLKVNHQRRRSFERNANNNVFMSDHNHTNTTMTEMEEIAGPVKSHDDNEGELNRHSATPDVIPRIVDADYQTIELDSDVSTMTNEAINSTYMSRDDSSPAISVENQLMRKPNENQSNGLDDIELADDVKMSCIEKREPNGKVYFIEMDLGAPTLSHTDAAPPVHSEMVSLGEDVIIQQMVDTVLFQEHRSDHQLETIGKALPLRSDSDNLSEDETEVEDTAIETRAIVHTVNDGKEIQTTPAIAIEPKAATEEKPFFTFGVYPTAQPPHSQSARFTSESIGRNKEFKERLSRLLGQFNDESTKFSAPLERKRSISTPDSINLASMAADRRPPLKLLIGDDIPVPPKFDQMMYDTMGRRARKQTDHLHMPATAMCVENEFTKSFDELAAGSSLMHRSQKSVDLMKLFDQDQANETDSEAESGVSIRDRLNEIYGRTRPPIVPFIEYDINNDSTNSRRGSEEGIQLSKAIKPYDTVHKQKQIFSDVLKSINPDVRNSLHRTDSMASADVQAATHKGQPKAIG